MSATDYSFEMSALRKDVLGIVADHVRDGDFAGAKHAAAREIRRHSPENPEQDAKAFRTSFDKAKTMVEDGGRYDIDIDPMPALLPDHDAELTPGLEINGEVTEVVTSYDHSGFGDPDTSVYPVVDHGSGFRVCTCGAQKYYTACPHTLARVVERNWADAPLP